MKFCSVWTATNSRTEEAPGGSHWRRFKLGLSEQRDSNTVRLAVIRMKRLTISTTIRGLADLCVPLIFDHIAATTNRLAMCNPVAWTLFVGNAYAREELAICRCFKYLAGFFIRNSSAEPFGFQTLHPNLGFLKSSFTTLRVCLIKLSSVYAWSARKRSLMKIWLKSFQGKPLENALRQPKIRSYLPSELEQYSLDLNFRFLGNLTLDDSWDPKSPPKIGWIHLQGTWYELHNMKFDNLSMVSLPASWGHCLVTGVFDKHCLWHNFMIELHRSISSPEFLCNSYAPISFYYKKRSTLIRWENIGNFESKLPNSRNSFHPVW